MSTRTIRQRVPAYEVTEGAGVTVHRSIGTPALRNLDPFLLLDHFGSDNPDEYIAGFPDHPHRGFITFTYMLDGHMRHEDSVGNRGDLGPGDVQWMSAARGSIHSEMPQQSEGRMRGFQLWINLPAKEKMKDPGYRDIPSDQIPTVDLDNGGQVRVIAGTLVQQGNETAGAVGGLTTDPLYLDVRLPAGGIFETPITSGYNAFLYLYEGDASVGDDGQALDHRSAGLLSDGDSVRVQASDAEARFLLLAAKPLGEPVVQYGPFVMNTREEIEQAVRDYQSGKLTASLASA